MFREQIEFLKEEKKLKTLSFSLSPVNIQIKLTILLMVLMLLLDANKLINIISIIIMKTMVAIKTVLIKR